MRHVALVTLKGVFRDRTFHGIGVVACLFLLLPVVASLSLRQVSELSVNLSLSLVSFILLLLALFLGGVSLWKDLDRRQTFSLLGLPLTRTSYLLGKFCGIAVFLTLVVAFLSVLAAGVVFFSTMSSPPSRPLNWDYFALALFFDLLKYLLVVAIAFLFSTISTSFFLPLFGTIAVFLVGSATQEAFDFLQTEAGRNLPLLVQKAAAGLYYVLPNLSAFDLKLNAVYGVAVDGTGLLLTLLYFFAYLGLVLFAATFVFNRRELK